MKHLTEGAPQSSAMGRALAQGAAAGVTRNLLAGPGGGSSAGVLSAAKGGGFGFGFLLSRKVRARARAIPRDLVARAEQWGDAPPPPPLRGRNIVLYIIGRRREHDDREEPARRDGAMWLTHR